VKPSTWDGTIPKAIWGFNGTERPGAVYLAAALAAHAMKGLPAFGIYGHDVQMQETRISLMT
jgi:L-fucose isomerase